ncbi:abscission/NoCut checkpoint regulator [Schistocerca piceifrons]|uniref:abscission/NoCut checkpoint regulator n=1 Tax=Schistocerca piceifrons TaxID=274613 RepID=UPI001F5ECF8D|nr:abscission/NoCut checkpoint regulator [Schistocerca piceifrons]XP_047116313.1 abscission/NoCut checkpoint regulator [Schistocerca piceifrons]
MSCRGCASNFGFFRKEVGCPNCGFSYCAKCLKYKVIVPKLGTSHHLVCQDCYKKLENQHIGSSEPVLPPSQAVIKSLESLENPAKPPIIVYVQDQRLKNLKHGMTSVDREILNRLEKLREERKQQPAPNEEEIARRLATLKGQDPDYMQAISRKQVYMIPDTRTDTEKTHDLVKQFMEEDALAAKLEKPEDEITRRLALLRGKQDNSQKQQEKTLEGGIDTAVSVDNPDALLAKLTSEMSDAGEAKDLSERMKKLSVKKKMSIDGSSSNDEEEITEEVIKRAVDEVSLPSVESSETGTQNMQFADDMDTELPWCIICNEDATKRCHGCNGDLYCDRCYAEGHDVWDMKEHKTSPFK